MSLTMPDRRGYKTQIDTQAKDRVIEGISDAAICQNTTIA